MNIVSGHFISKAAFPKYIVTILISKEKGRGRVRFVLIITYNPLHLQIRCRGDKLRMTTRGWGQNLCGKKKDVAVSPGNSSNNISS